MLSTGLDFDSAVITVPANSRGLARHRTKVCAGMGGINPIALINEPTAAAMAYAQRHDIDQQNVLVFDFGEGTLDVTVLAVNDGLFFEQGSSGIARLGGVDFDRAILRHISEEFPDSSEWSSADKSRLRFEIEKAKIQLSSSDKDETIIHDPQLGLTFRLTRPQFNDLTRPLVERSGKAIRRTLSDLHMTADSVDQVLLVGGTSKVPAVRHFVSELLGKAPATGVDPMTAIGEGAAVAAAIMSGEIPDSDFFLSTEHAMGTIIADTAAQQLRFGTVIPKNQKLPARQTETFVPVMDSRDSVIVTVLEGDEVLPIGHPDNLVLASFPVPPDPPRPASEVQINLTYTYDTDGLIHGDYSADLGLEKESFDLLVSPYAGFVSEACTDYLRIGGVLLVAPSRGDTAMAAIDSRYQLSGVVTSRSGDYRVRTDSLDTYLIPKDDIDIAAELLHKSGRGIRYTKSPFAYLFTRIN